jgi:predicted DNA-binding transcriptional regulator YafY
MTEFDRIFKYYEFFSNRIYLTKTDLMAELEISCATFKRDLAFLRDRLGMPIVYDRDMRAYYLDKKQKALAMPGLWFSYNELQGLKKLSDLRNKYPEDQEIQSISPLLLRVKELYNFY